MRTSGFASLAASSVNNNLPKLEHLPCMRLFVVAKSSR